MRCNECLRVIPESKIAITPTLDPDYPEEDNVLLSFTCPYCYETERIIIKRK